MADKAARLTMFAYPWDMKVDGVAESVGLVANAGCRQLALAVAYHSADVLAPRREHRAQAMVEANVAHLALRGAFSGLALRTGTLAAQYPGLGAEIARAADQAGIGLTAWVILCHNSALATEQPAASLEDCFGGRSGHALCPSNPKVRTYALELCRQVLEIGIFDELFVESAAYLVAPHGHPHEIAAVRDDPATRYLRSLCFCPSCLSSGSSMGIDGRELREWVKRALSQTWNSEVGLVRRADPGDELASLLVARADLAGWTAMRCDQVTSLVAALADLARSYGARLSTALGIFARPAALGWMEGVDPFRLAAVSDLLTATPYYREYEDVARDLDHYFALVQPERMQVVQTLWPKHHVTLDGLLAKVELAWRAGVREFGLYNLTTAPTPALAWAGELARWLEGVHA